MLPTPARAVWSSSSALIATLRRRMRSANSWTAKSHASGSGPSLPVTVVDLSNQPDAAELPGIAEDQRITVGQSEPGPHVSYR